MTGPDKPQPDRSGRWLTLLAIPVLCCAGPALLTALGLGSVGALIGGTIGSRVVVLTGLVVTIAALLILLRRRRSVTKMAAPAKEALQRSPDIKGGRAGR